jgi:hypothetical protein
VNTFTGRSTGSRSQRRVTGLGIVSSMFFLQFSACKLRK